MNDSEQQPVPPRVNEVVSPATENAGSASEAGIDTEPMVSQRQADLVLLVETLADFSSEERLVTPDELLDAFMESASHMPPVSVAQVEEELGNLLDPRFEGPDAATVAAEMKRVKEMEKTMPGSAPDPIVPGIRDTRRLLSRRELLLSLLHSPESQTLKAPEVPPESVVETVEPTGKQLLRTLDREYAESLLEEALVKDEGVARFTSWDGKEYCHYKPLLSGNYARIISAENNPVVQVANVVRDNSRDYPRPVPVEILEYPPFNLEAEVLQQCLNTMAEDPAFADIRYTESSVGTVYLYSSTYMDEGYAAYLAEDEDMAAIESP